MNLQNKYNLKFLKIHNAGKFLKNIEVYQVGVINSRPDKLVEVQSVQTSFRHSCKCVRPTLYLNKLALSQKPIYLFICVPTNK